MWRSSEGMSSHITGLSDDRRRCRLAVAWHNVAVKFRRTRRKAYESWRDTGHANVWGLMSIDAERGLSTYRRARRAATTGEDAEKVRPCLPSHLVCLDARTGERKWHFQAVHHRLWD